MSRFELFIAGRYLRAHRKEAVISVITAISVLGVAAGVMALVVALAVTNGFRNTLQRNLLGAMAHINVVPRTPGDGIENWQELVETDSQGTARDGGFAGALQPHIPEWAAAIERRVHQRRGPGFGTGVERHAAAFEGGQVWTACAIRARILRAFCWARGWRKISGCG